MHVAGLLEVQPPLAAGAPKDLPDLNVETVAIQPIPVREVSADAGHLPMLTQEHMVVRSISPPAAHPLSVELRFHHAV
eukprot:2524307-Pyramimonas_sp.AAC.1